MSIDLSNLSEKELKLLIRNAEKTIVSRKDNVKRNLQLKFRQMAADEGLSLTDIIGTAQARSPVAVKYRDNNGNTWTGRGRIPRWLSNAIANGNNKEDYAV